MLVQAITQVEHAILQTRQGLDAIQQQLDTELAEYDRSPQALVSQLDTLQAKTRALASRQATIQERKQVSKHELGIVVTVVSSVDGKPRMFAEDIGAYAV
jgi:predicted  nucleic acid-binding Zn-ribbon protein